MNLSLKETNMMEMERGFGLEILILILVFKFEREEEGFWEGMKRDMVSNVRNLPTSFVVEKL